jgi:hypothetical protein
LPCSLQLSGKPRNFKQFSIQRLHWSVYYILTNRQRFSIESDRDLVTTYDNHFQQPTTEYRLSPITGSSQMLTYFTQEYARNLKLYVKTSLEGIEYISEWQIVSITRCKCSCRNLEACKLHLVKRETRAWMSFSMFGVRKRFRKPVL